MGDVGSILLGFVFAALVIWCSTNFLDFLCMASFLFPFYADEITTEIIRLKDGEKLWQPHRRHLYQLLANECQIAHWKVSFGYGLGQLTVGLSTLIFKTFGVLMISSLIWLYFFIFIVISNVVRKKAAASIS
jgi:Fuc2NAc and GlcNAc transferase